ncbi:hypothetical protein JOD45_000170 [Scopulibacillus daqui]|uniref:Membrane-anchored protein n=1 Tax=Scopulibacillus daqui TaxID=1469162 RepID=A0ABS2PV91_9BACL|nr:hypothetical protein [Scopulibacillus daqui]MBM7643979.1 hypothetical protein [Scopulibacillus daqui]
MKLSKDSHKHYLKLINGNKIRRGVIAFLLCLNLSSIMGLIYHVNELYYDMNLITMLVGDLLGLIFIVAPYKFEREFLLYLGLYGFFAIINCFATSQSLIIGELGFTNKLITYIDIVLLLIVGFGFYIFHIWALKNDYYVKTSNSINVTIIIIAVGIAYLSSQVGSTFFTNIDFETLSLIIGLQLFIIVGFIMTTFVHKYIYILKHEQDLKKMYPYLGQSKKQRFENRRHNKLKEKSIIKEGDNKFLR